MWESVSLSWNTGRYIYAGVGSTHRWARRRPVADWPWRSLTTQWAAIAPPLNGQKLWSLETHEDLLLVLWRSRRQLKGWNHSARPSVYLALVRSRSFFLFLRHARQPGSGNDILLKLNLIAFGRFPSYVDRWRINWCAAAVPYRIMGTVASQTLGVTNFLLFRPIFSFPIQRYNSFQKIDRIDILCIYIYM